jgi:hypothetical protein
MDPDTKSNHTDAGDTGAVWHEVPADGELGGTVHGFGAWWGAGPYQDPDSYWRRRFFILAGGFAILCAMTWGLSVLLGPPKSTQPTGKGNAHAAELARAKVPAAAYGIPPGTTTAPGKGAGQRAPSSGAGLGAPGACQPGRIVLSLFTSHARYSLGQQPQFEVYAVSTASVPCDLAYDSSVVRVMVTSQGHVVWDSAACDSRGPAVPGAAHFTPGVPRAVTVSWNGQAGIAGCAGPTGTGAAGTFDAVATADGQSSPVRTFTLIR